MDLCLYNSISLMRGDVIDIGGKRQNKLGDFRPPMLQVKSWQYLNIDSSTNPDYSCNAESIPVDDCYFDVAVMSEVLEHIENPEMVLKETFRILREGGALILSVPFLFPFHADPNDFQRFTDVKMRIILEKAGFTEIKIIPMGGTGSVIHDIMLVSFNSSPNKYLKSIGHLFLHLTKSVYILLDKLLTRTERAITTGYFVTAKKVKI